MPCFYMSGQANLGTCTQDEDSAYRGFILDKRDHPVSPNQNTVESKLISKIQAGLTEINFFYSVRTDLAGRSDLTTKPQKLDRIEINQINQNQTFVKCIKKFTFGYTTEISTDSPNPNYSGGDTTVNKRLFLNNLTEISCDGSIAKPYQFTYNATHLPNRLSYAQDKWGYYNGKTGNPNLLTYNGTSLITGLANRYPDGGYVKAGTLEKITYPTKGSVNFEYELNSSYDATAPNNTPSYFITTPVNQGNILMLSSPVFSSSTFNESTFTYTPTGNPNEKWIITAALNINAINSYPPCVNDGYQQKAFEIIDTVTNTMVYYDYYTSQTRYPGAISLEGLTPALVYGRTYKVKAYSYNGNCKICSVYITGGPATVTPVYDVGGFRVKKIVHANYDGSVVKQTNYSYFEPKISINPSTGKRADFNYNNSFDSMNGILSLNTINYFKNWMNSVISNQDNYGVGYYYYFSAGSDPLELVDFRGPQISYNKVIETDGNGTTTHIFYPYKSYFELNNYSSAVVLPPAPRFQSILAGNKVSVTQQNNTNATVKIDASEYNYATTNTTINSISAIAMTGITATPFNSYTIQGQTKTLKTETETTNLGGQSLTTQKNYEYLYNNIPHNQPTKTTVTNSKGEQLITQIYYPQDLLNESLMPDLVAQNRIGSPIKTESFNGTTKLSEQKTTYAKDATTSSLLLPKSVYAAKFPNSLPLLPTPINSTLEKKVTSDVYDTNGTLLQYTPENGIPVAVIWGYNRTQPIAKIENATYAQVTAQVANLQTLSDTGTEANLILALTNLRNSLPNSMIITYTYKPLIGVSTITDTKGYVTYYNYDAFGRLQNVKDAQGNIISENQYHYKN